MHGRWLARAAVLALHLVLLAWLGLGRQPPARPAEPGLATVRLIPLPPPPKAPPSRQVAAARPAATAADRATVAARSAAEAATAETPAQDTPPPPTEPARSTLRLSLPPGIALAPRNPALDDPRANTPRLTLEERLADAMGGDGRWIEEDLGEGRRRFRRGDTCVMSYASRTAQIAPFNESVKPTLRTVGKPYKCR